ncbi:hypothetical protein DL769_005097 [Monosporascus sp. CRB-8-3]|nr:hypothetical protein DL769_005097 [Monosporascus sp. CRB-8-3]
MHLLAVVLIALAGQTLAAPSVGEGLAIRNVPEGLPPRFCIGHCDRLCNSPVFSPPLRAFIRPCCINNCRSACQNAAVAGEPVIEA